MGKIGVINGLRGLAVIMVVYQHLFGDFTYPGWYTVNLLGVDLFPLSYLSNGWVGVNLFFILSGFVLYLPYATGTRRMYGRADAVGFYRHRSTRLLPLYYISLLFLVFLNGRVAIDSDTPERFLYMMTMTFSFTDLWIPRYNPVLWSLAVEFWFCLLFPLLVVLANRYGVYRVFLAIVLLSLAVRFFGVYVPYFDTPKSHYLNAMKDSVLGRLDDFVLGMCAVRFYLEKGEGRRGFSAAGGLVAGFLIILVGCNLWDYKVLGLLPMFWIPLLNNILQAGFFLVIISALSLEKGALKVLLTNHPLQVLGLMCYSLYIWHRVAQFMILKTGYTPMNLLFYFAFLLAFSALTYRYIEYGSKGARELFAKSN